MDVYLIDGTYELFRHYFAVPKHRNDAGEEVGAVRGVVRSVLGMLDEGATHIGVATDHVIESFRNELWPGYKSSAGIEPDLLSQFPLLEDALRALGVVVWAMTELEADDALAAAAATAARDPNVGRVLICTPDKDLAQSVSGTRVVQFDRRKRELRDEAGVVEKFGVSPSSIPDWLALVGDSADGFPGVPGWGPKSAALVLARYGHLDEIPDESRRWDVEVRGAMRLARSLSDQRDDALLFRHLATLRADADVLSSVDELHWEGSVDGFDAVCRRLDALGLTEDVARLRRRPGA